jgi:hypothetical protein
VALTLTDLSAGHVFEPIVLSVDADSARAYRAAVTDSSVLFDAEGIVPPLVVAALALGALLNQVGLPPGTLHVNEALAFNAAIHIGARLECHATLAQRSQRAGWIVSVLDSEISLDGVAALTARATVLSPAGPS